MGRFLFVGGLACLVLGLVALPALADDDAGLKQEVQKLRQEVAVMQSSMLEKEIDAYLSETQAWQGAQGGDALGGITIHASFTAVYQGTVGQSSNGAQDINSVDGDVDLQFDFQVTDNLNLFIHMTANNSGGGSFPNIFGQTFVSAPFNAIGGPSLSAATLAGATDGIGVNGTVPTAPGSVTVYEAGISSSVNLGDNKLNWEIGALDPRTRFLQNRFADDENTQFVDNLFDDSSAVLWLTDASGRVSLGVHGWISFGDNQQFTLNFGYFNMPGQYFNSGQFYLQLSWKGEVNGREMNVHVMGWYQEFFGAGKPGGTFGNGTSLDNDETGVGVSWDWMVTENIGAFFRTAYNNADINPVDYDISGGAVFKNLIASRPDDVIGIAFGLVHANNNVLVGVPEDQELHLEIYYRFMAEDGKLQVTPNIIFVNNPGGGIPPFADDTLFILGLRIHVPF